jgi:hypothetical protein
LLSDKYISRGAALYNKAQNVGPFDRRGRAEVERVAGDGAFEGEKSNVAIIIVFFHFGIFKGKPEISLIFIDFFANFFGRAFDALRISAREGE